MNDDAERSPAGEKHFELGIVLVHGIGNHKQGETLLQFGEHLLDCLQRRITALWHEAAQDHAVPLDTDAERYYESVRLGTKRVVYIDDAVPIPAKRLDADNAYAHLKISLPRRENGQTKRHTVRWNVQESWWAEQVIEPSANDVINWMMTRGPWVIGQFYYERHRAQRREAEQSHTLAQAWMWARSVFYLAMSVTFSLLAQAVLLLFALGSLVPVLKRWVGPALLTLAGVLGDAYVLIVQDVQHTAMITRLRETIQNLHATSEKVVVLAHSQGSGVLFDCLTVAHPHAQWTPDHIITFGSGVAKLKTLFYAEARESWSMQVAGWIPLGGVTIAALVVGGFLWLSKSVVSLTLTIAACAIFAGLLFVYGLTRLYLMNVYKRCLEVFQHKATKQVTPHSGATWTDFYASHDAVPIGSLTQAAHVTDEFGLLGYGATSESITNERSWLSDHVTYLQNKYEFCAPVAEKLLQWSGYAPRDYRDTVTHRAHCDLSSMRGAFEHVLMYALVAAMPFCLPADQWLLQETVSSVTGGMRTLCTTFLPDFVSTPMCIPKNTNLPFHPNFKVGTWMVVAGLGYGLCMRLLAQLQAWWRNEISNACLQGTPFSEARARFVCLMLMWLYLVPMLSMLAFFAHETRALLWLAVISAAVSQALLWFGGLIARERDSARRLEVRESLHALGTPAT
jgi:hypothetical protein